MRSDENPYDTGPQIDQGHDSQTASQYKNISKVVGRVLLIAATAIILLALFLPFTRSARGPTRSWECKNKLKNIALALHSYAARNGGKFPPAYTVDAEGKPLHSWRTLILNYIDRRDLAEKIDLTKPWDDPVNAELGKEYIKLYCCPEEGNNPNLTTYLAVVGPNAFLNATEPRDMNTIVNPGNTIGVIDMGASQAVPWMSPQDTDEHAVLSLGHSIKFAHAGNTNIAHPDGSVGSLNADTSISERHKLISITGE